MTMFSPIQTLESLSERKDELQTTIDQLKNFRQQLYYNFKNRPDAIISLLDALCSNTTAQSVVQLSLNLMFPYSYNSIYNSIQNFFIPSQENTAVSERYAHEQQLMRLISDYLPAPTQHSFWLLGVDVTSVPRRFGAYHTHLMLERPRLAGPHRPRHPVPSWVCCCQKDPPRHSQPHRRIKKKSFPINYCA